MEVYCFHRGVILEFGVMDSQTRFQRGGQSKVHSLRVLEMGFSAVKTAMSYRRGDSAAGVARPGTGVGVDREWAK